MLKMIFLVLTLICGVDVFAADYFSSDVSLSEIEKARKRVYAGGRDEEDLKVLATLPEAIRKSDTRTVQREVYKDLFKEDLKEEPSEQEPESEH